VAPHRSTKATDLFHDRFAAEYLRDLNATQAYLRCKNGTVKETTAAVEGWKLLRIPKVQQAIAAGAKKQLDALEMTASNVMHLIWSAATLDPSEMFDAEWNLLPLSKMSARARLTIDAIEVARANLDKTDGKKSEEFLFKVKHIKKEKALEMLAKHFRLITDIVEHKEPVDWDKRIARIRAARRRVGDKDK